MERLLILFFVCLFLQSNAQTDNGHTFRLPGRSKNKSPQTATDRPAQSSQNARAIFLTLQISSDLKGKFWLGSHSYEIEPGDEIELPIEQSSIQLFFKGENGFSTELKQNFQPDQKGSVIRWTLDLQEEYDLFLRKLEREGYETQIINEITQNMVLINRDMDDLAISQSTFFEMGRYEITVEQFALYISESKQKSAYHDDPDSSYILLPNSLIKRGFVQGIDWRHSPAGRPYSMEEYNHPVVNVSWEEAMAFCSWLSEQDKHYVYSLPTVDEWLYACDAFKNLYPWEGQLEHAWKKANLADRSLRPYFQDRKSGNYDDGFPFTAPVGSFEPNEYSIYDLGGNAAEWCLDDFPERTGKQSRRKVVMGGSFFSSPEDCLSQKGYPWGMDKRHGSIGFRVCRKPRN